jgi:hypothetical protein
MTNVAHAGSLEHEVLQKTFQGIPPKYEERDTPSNYREYPGGADLPKKMKVWVVQENIPGSVVSRGWGFSDSPDAEVLVVGLNHGKEYAAVGVGRHGNFLQWGYSAPPSKMTEAGQRLFLNCISYIHKFDGKGPLIRRQQSDRINPIRLAMVLDKIKDKDFFSSVFTREQIDKHQRDPAGLIQYYMDNYEWIYWDGVYRVDEELKALRIPSNRVYLTLQRLIELLDDEQNAQTARKLLRRYTIESFEQPAEWRKWLIENRDRLYFSDVGGYKFRVVPKGYLDRPLHSQPAASTTTTKATP